MPQQKFSGFFSELWEKHKKSISFGILTIFALCIFVLQMNYKKTKSPNNYLLAQKYYSQWKNTEDDQSLQNLVSLLEKCPEICPQYDFLITQKSIFNGKANHAKSSLQRMIKRNEKILPLHTLFAQATEKMIDRDFAAALELSLKIEQQASDNTYLYGINLIRIAQLYSAMQDHDQAKIRWELVNTYLTAANDPSGVRTSLKEHLTQGNISLCDFSLEQQAKYSL